MTESETKTNCWEVIGIFGDSSCADLTRFSHCHHCPVFSATGRRLLDRPFQEDHVSVWASRIAQEKPLEESKQLTSLLVFRVASEWLALPATCMTAVTPLRPVHSVPHLSDTVFKGIVNMDGQLMLCISLQWLVADSGAEEGSPPPAGTARMIAISRAGQQFVLLADDVLGVQALAPQALQDPPATLQKSPTALLRGIFLIDNRTVGLFDEEKLFDALNRRITR
jgi:chemotaxis-related protein WspD